MLRDPESGKFLIKMKFPYYLVTKFIARMGTGNYELLFRNPEKFITSKQIDEEFFPLIEYIVANEKTFIALDEQGKVEAVREFIEKQLWGG